MPDLCENQVSPAAATTGDCERYVAGALIANKYELEVPLGEGGMGTVWRARNVTLDAKVALKLIRPTMMGEETIKRLLIEARVEAKLKHPNLVRVFDFGQTPLGDSFIVMEFLEGISLGDLIDQRGRLEPVEAVQLVLPVIAALCHAHDNAVVHRDLKPHNIFLDRSHGRTAPKLLDFGIAKLLDEPQHHVNERGLLLGSPAYMAPEQARGSEHVDHRSDIWAICVVIYEAIAGGAAFPGEGYAVLRGVIQDELQPLADHGAGEDTLWAILKRGLQKDPSARPQSMLELGTALAQWLNDRGEWEDLDGNRISRSWNLMVPTGNAGPRTPRPQPAADVRFAPAEFERPRRELEMLALAVQATHPGFHHPVPRRSWARAGCMAAAAAAAIAVMFIPGNTLHRPAPEHVVMPAAAASLASATTASGATNRALAEAPREQQHLALGDTANPEAAMLLTQIADAQRGPEPIAPVAVERRAPKRSVSSEADLGLKVPYE